ncbi:hypothetical protein [Enterococcus faecalis]|uniref:TrbL/VirB6 plasmid conjugal transfer protein n=2 Tax=Enterococcus faecium TaxID=1352 RepID=A0A6A8NKU7_ENTFC|nr:hypothetical protein [Enterococcus faecalis]MBD9751723.1 hypothetical protein [Enterococcus faecium]MTD24787.1 hypothetical protein [Enterococcus faecium]MTD36579.1 hypothetical protein [Enterococcus faecium]NMO62272.1 hypothetical protein [Enterococcus faecium]RXW93026.1 hypothetical protein CYQ60_06600 [Enterococcus faecium]
MMDGFLTWCVESILEVISFSSKTSHLTSNLENFSPQLYKYSTTILDSVSKPIAFSILALFFALELQRISNRVETNGGGQTGFEMIFKSLVRLGLCKLAMDQVSLIMRAIMDITGYMTDKINHLGMGNKEVSDMLDAKKILAPILKEGLMFKVGVSTVLIIALLITIGSIVIVQVVVNMRFIELYAFLAMSPIPIATFPNDEWSSIGKNFLKSFTATALQGTLIFMVMQFYPYLLSSAFSDITNSGSASETFLMALIGIIGNSVLLIFAVMATGRWSKSITNAM